MERDFTIYSVGKPFDPQVKQWPEGGMYIYHQEVHHYLLLFHHIRLFEQRAFERGTARFGLYVEEDVIIVLLKMDDTHGRQGIKWLDAPYSWHLVPAQAQTLPEPPEAIPADLGAIFTLFLIEASTGIITAMRSLNVSHDFTKHLHQAIREQTTRPFDKQAYLRQIEALRRKFPTPLSMAQAAQARCLGGIYEQSGS